MNPMPHEIVLADFSQSWVLGRHLEQNVNRTVQAVVQARPRTSQTRKRAAKRIPVARTRPARRSRLRKTTKAAGNLSATVAAATQVLR